MFTNKSIGLNTAGGPSLLAPGLRRELVWCCMPLALCASFTANAEAASADVALESVVVTATALPTEYEKIGSSLTVVSGQQIEDGGYNYVSDVLRQVPGLAVNRTGPYGGLTQVRTRGAEGNHTIVLFNG